MTLSRWRRIATGIAAGVIVLSAALIGASFRDSDSGVSVASDLRPTNVIPIEEDPADADEGSDTSQGSDTDSTDPVQVIEVEDLPDPDAADDPDAAADTDTADDPDAAGATDAADDTDASDDPDASGATDDEVADATEEPAADATDGDATASDTADSDTTDSAAEPAEPAATPEPVATAEPAAPITSGDDSLGTGGGVDDAECALDRLVIYAGARRGGVAGSIRAALAQAGFGAGCATPVTVLASNCPQQFAGVLGAGSGYDPTKSYVASSASVDRETMAAVMGTVGYSGNEIDILDFGFVNPDGPGEQWIAIFVPPSFSGWENLASRAGLSPTSSSLCAASGELAG